MTMEISLDITGYSQEHCISTLNDGVSFKTLRYEQVKYVRAMLSLGHLHVASQKKILEVTVKISS